MDRKTQAGHVRSFCQKLEALKQEERGQILVEGLVLMLFLTTALVVIVNFTKYQDGVLKKYELSEKIRAEKNR